MEKNILIWIGQFDSEVNFAQYLDQSEFQQWWKKYDEDNLELSCQFCKELGISSYDEDFLIIKYCPHGFDELLKLIPASTEDLEKKCKAKKINQANSVICYNAGEDISFQQADNAKSMYFLGTFQFEISEVNSKYSFAGLQHMTWAGITNKSKEEFMQYFNQDKYLEELNLFNEGKITKRPDPNIRCQFCKDINIDFYHPEFLNVKIEEKIVDATELVQLVVNDEQLNDVIDFVLKKKNVTKVNCVFSYIPNGFRDKKKDKKALIFNKEFIGRRNKPKNYVDELDEYNGLTYLGAFMWD
ncbi:immunity 22 family protein [Bacteroides sp. ET336]|uniref:immunity 22 family protein n=1 Tax=Bacteroides sp. ET336 TaxID=2972459 RepID=UPI0021ABD978|nr:immunity 22 family protein [Bacteroides sp. ET336]MBS6470363.1 immunity 22 family protein [Bacteroides sp.]MCR8895158.1 immunity 22 family protein [Bacteroides sp. ET336]MDN0059654.1 immunity 22 family protein [Bacteroides caecigallinarum]